MASNSYQKTKWACYYIYIATSAVFVLPPMLFVTLREMYEISYTLLGTLVLIGFCTQLTVDLLSSFFATYLPVKLLIRLTPLLTTLGLSLYALIPTCFPSHAYLGLVLGTVVFSVSTGLNEVLVSPMIAAIPSDNPERDMSRLHSIYGYGVVFVVTLSSLLLLWWGNENWMWLTLFWAILPIFASVLFCLLPIPEMKLGAVEGEGKTARHHKIGLWLCFLCIFLGGATEVTMTSWISVYMENALKISKSVCDIVGLALFAFLLALGRTAYAKWGKNIEKVMLFSMTSSIICYIIAGITTHPVVGAIGAVLTGISSAMLWPGTLILAEKHLPHPGVAAYALLAAGGDLGGSLGPQAVGYVVDAVTLSPFAATLAEGLSLTPEQIGIKAGVLVGVIFPLAGLFVVISLIRYFKKLQRNS